MLNDRDGATFKKPELVKRKCRKHTTLNNWKINSSYKKIKYHKTGRQRAAKKDLLRRKSMYGAYMYLLVQTRSVRSNWNPSGHRQSMVFPTITQVPLLQELPWIRHRSITGVKTTKQTSKLASILRTVKAAAF